MSFIPVLNIMSEHREKIYRFTPDISGFQDGVKQNNVSVYDRYLAFRVVIGITKLKFKRAILNF